MRAALRRRPPGERGRSPWKVREPDNGTCSPGQAGGEGGEGSDAHAPARKGQHGLARGHAPSGLVPSREATLSPEVTRRHAGSASSWLCGPELRREPRESLDPRPQAWSPSFQRREALPALRFGCSVLVTFRIATPHRTKTLVFPLSKPTNTTVDACLTGKSREPRAPAWAVEVRQRREAWAPGRSGSEAKHRCHQLCMCTSPHSSWLTFLVIDSGVQSGPLWSTCRGMSGFLALVTGGGTSTLWLHAGAQTL